MTAVTGILEACALEQIELFRFVSPESVEGILESCSIRELERGEILIVPGRSNRNLYVVLSGRLRIHLDSPAGEPLTFIERGETVGEMSVIDHDATSAYVVADGECRLLVMDERLVWSLVRVSHAAACNLLAILSRRLRKADAAIVERMESESAYQQFGSFDALTGLHNRHWLDRTLPRQLKRCVLSGTPFSLIVLDIDYFKRFNDVHGHLCGDRALHAVARVMMENLRPSEMAVRYGGDEFVVLLPGADLAGARIVAERLCRKIADSEVHSAAGAAFPSLTVSMGIAQAEPGQTGETLMAAGDAALYRAKDQGRNTVSE